MREREPQRERERERERESVRERERERESNVGRYDVIPAVFTIQIQRLRTYAFSLCSASVRSKWRHNRRGLLLCT